MSTASGFSSLSIIRRFMIPYTRSDGRASFAAVLIIIIDNPGLARRQSDGLLGRGVANKGGPRGRDENGDDGQGRSLIELNGGS